VPSGASRRCPDVRGAESVVRRSTYLSRDVSHGTTNSQPLVPCTQLTIATQTGYRSNCRRSLSSVRGMLESQQHPSSRMPWAVDCHGRATGRYARSYGRRLLACSIYSWGFRSLTHHRHEPATKLWCTVTSHHRSSQLVSRNAASKPITTDLLQFLALGVWETAAPPMRSL